MKVLPLILALLASLVLPVAAQQYFTVQPNPGTQHSAYQVFEKYVDALGVGIFADAAVSDADVLHAANVMAQYLDNNADGIPDNPDVMNVMTNTFKAHLIMFETQAAHTAANFESSLPDSWMDTHMLQPLYGFETFPQGSGNWGFDATLEEVLHLITANGYAKARPSTFGETAGTTLALAMEQAKTGGFYNPTANEPNLPYPVQVTEYLYWVLTSVLGAQDYAGRLQNIQAEWSLNTAAKVQASNPLGYTLCTSPAHNLPTVLPNGNYQPNGSQPTNQPPSADAGAAVSITLPINTAVLNASYTDDGFSPPGQTNFAWTTLSGPSTVSFSPSASVLKPTASFPAAGTYILRLAAGDGQFSVTDTVSVTVNPAPPAPTNQPPTVDAGPAVNLAWPAASTVMQGTWSDDGFSPPGQTNLAWSKISGPGNVTFSPAASIRAPTVSFSMPGSYVLQLAGSDGQFSSSDTVTVTITSNSTPTLAEALDTPALTWTSGGTGSNWFLQTSVTHDGNDAAQSSRIGNGGYTWMETTVTGPGSLSFYWRVSSEEAWDFLGFMIDGTTNAFRSGTSGGWQLVTSAVPAGVHTLRWAYHKDTECCTDGADAGYVDQVVYIPESTSSAPTNYAPALTNVTGGGQVGIVFDAANLPDWVHFTSDLQAWPSHQRSPVTTSTWIDTNPPPAQAFGMRYLRFVKDL